MVKQKVLHSHPKTDIVVGKDRISVKTGDAQLMSGGRSEALATFYTELLRK